MKFTAQIAEIGKGPGNAMSRGCWEVAIAKGTLQKDGWLTLGTVEAVSAIAGFILRVWIEDSKVFADIKVVPTAPGLHVQQIHENDSTRLSYSVLGKVLERQGDMITKADITGLNVSIRGENTWMSKV